MIQRLLILVVITTTAITAQQPYYDTIDITLTGEDMFNALQELIEVHNQNYTYGEFRDDLLITDANTSNSSEVLLEYGFNDSDGDCTTDRTRSNSLFGGNACDYNREHVFPRSSANPPMGNVNNNTIGIAADPHNLRPTDVQRNGLRGSRRFTSGSGNSGVTGANWYPGDEWRGDVARVAMYMYVRYGNRCLPEFVGTGAFQGNTEMLQLFLQWNAEDPVSEAEEQRNPHFENVYGNRNPFIDNPFLATIIWGGPEAENLWDALSVDDIAINELKVFPNPAEKFVTIQSLSLADQIVIYTLSGKVVTRVEPTDLETQISVENLNTGMYLVQIDNRIQKLIIK